MKNKKISRILTALLAAVCVVSMANGALAAQTLALDSGVTLSEVNGQARFAINGGDQGDLFLDFKDVMPGDKLSQTIRVNAAEGNSQSYRIFLYARECAEADVPEEGKHIVQATDDGFLQWLNISVGRKAASSEAEDVSIGGVEIGEGTGLNGVLLGTFTPGMSMELNVELEVDIEMGNDFANKAAYIDWVFYADTIPTGDGPGSGPTVPTPPAGPGAPAEPTPPDVDIEDPDVPLIDTPPTEEEILDEGVPMESMPPQTGDTSAVILWLGMAVLSGSGIIALAVSGRKTKQ